MRRVIAAAAFAAISAFGLGGTPASADACVGTLLCAVNGCYSTVNACPTAESCSGFVDVCPAAHPNDCHGSIDVCLGQYGTVTIDCGSRARPVCDLIWDLLKG